MSTNEKKQPIAPAIKAMAVGAELSFPMARYANVQNTLVRLRKQFPDKQWATSTLTGMVTVQRKY